MKATAILYTSQTGHTAHYAGILGKRIGMPVYSLREGEEKLEKGSVIVYFGWLMAGGVKGLKRAEKRFQVSCLCAVGIGESGSQTADIRKRTALPESVPVFSLQGGYREEKLPSLYRLVMQPVKKILIRSLSEKKDRSEQEENSLEMLRQGGDFVCEENLQCVIAALSENL